MASKKKEENQSSDKIDDVLRKEFGNNVFMTADFFTETEPEIIDLGPSLNTLLGGGLVSGSFVLLYGKYKTGKSQTCLHIAKKAQAQGYKIYYFNVEGRLVRRDLLGTKGLDLSPEKFEIIGSVEGKILNAEDYLKIAMSLLETKKKSLFILDSISQLCSSERHSKDVGERIRDTVPLMLANFTRKAANILPVNKNIFLGVAHIIANTSGMGHSPYSMSGGNKINYAADVKIKVTHSTAYEQNDRQIGQLVNLLCETSNLGPPGTKISTLLRYNYGLDEIFDVLNLAVDIGILQKRGGGWIEFANGEKSQGLENARDYLENNIEIYNDLVKQINDLLR